MSFTGTFPSCIRLKIEHEEIEKTDHRKKLMISIPEIVIPPLIVDYLFIFLLLFYSLKLFIIRTIPKPLEMQVKYASSSNL